MAYRRYTLPSLKLTRRPTDGQKCISTIHRGINSCPTQAEEPGFLHGVHSEESGILPGVSFPSQYQDGASDMIIPTEHELSCRSAVVGWDDIRDAVVTENAAMPLDQLCRMCEEMSCLRCRFCGPSCFYCSQCFRKNHSDVNLFHVAEQWEVRPRLCIGIMRWRFLRNLRCRGLQARGCVNHVETDTE